MRYALLCLVFPLAAVLLQGRARAQSPAPPATVEIQRLYLGSGEPERAGYENATFVVNDVYHVPQYLPGWPTSRSIWPRVVDVPCTALASGGLRCQGYSWTPAMGRAEYLYFRPMLAAATPVSSRSDDTAVAGGVAGPVPPDPAPEAKPE
jgi:hypothetical protein